MKQYIQKSKFETTHIEGEWIVLNTENYTITKLNGMGGFCFELLKETQSVQSIMRAIEQKYGAEVDYDPSHIEQFLLQLADCGLIQDVD